MKLFSALGRFEHMEPPVSMLHEQLRRSLCLLGTCTLAILFATFSIPAYAQVESNFSSGGGVRIGWSSTTCASGVAGAIRYNSASSGSVDLCNGSSWASVSGGGAAASPSRGIQFNSGNAFTASSNLVYTSTGRVGIGISTPAEALQVVGNIMLGDATAWDSGAQIQIMSGNNSGAHIQVGSTDNDLLLGSSQFEGVVATTTGTLIFKTGATWNAHPSTAGTERMRISTAGNVGINNNAPNATLDIVGDIEYTGVTTDVSDARLKENVTQLGQTLPSIMALNPVSFTMKSDPKHQTEFGFIAQEVQPLFPALVVTAPDADKTLSLNYVGLIAPLVKALQEQQSRIDTLEARISELERREKK